MWSLVIAAAMAALTGFYMMPAERSTMVEKNLEARELAESMGMYRQAVIAYFSAHDVTNTRVGIDTLKREGMVPTWSTLYTRSATSIWASYRDSTGVIYIYPATPAPTNIVSELLKLSQYSMTVGIYRASDHSLYSPVDGTRVALASLSGVSIPDAAPVWMAARN